MFFFYEELFLFSEIKNSTHGPAVKERRKPLKKKGGVEGIAKTDIAHVNDSITFLGHRIISTLRYCGDMCMAERQGAGFQFY